MSQFYVDRLWNKIEEAAIYLATHDIHLRDSTTSGSGIFPYPDMSNPYRRKRRTVDCSNYENLGVCNSTSTLGQEADSANFSSPSLYRGQCSRVKDASSDYYTVSNNNIVQNNSDPLDLSTNSEPRFNQATYSSANSGVANQGNPDSSLPGVNRATYSSVNSDVANQGNPDSSLPGVNRATYSSANSGPAFQNSGYPDYDNYSKYTNHRFNDNASYNNIANYNMFETPPIPRDVFDDDEPCEPTSTVDHSYYPGEAQCQSLATSSGYDALHLEHGANSATTNLYYNQNHGRNDNVEPDSNHVDTVEDYRSVDPGDCVTPATLNGNTETEAANEAEAVENWDDDWAWNTTDQSATTTETSCTPSPPRYNPNVETVVSTSVSHNVHRIVEFKDSPVENREYYTTSHQQARDGTGGYFIGNEYLTAPGEVPAMQSHFIKDQGIVQIQPGLVYGETVNLEQNRLVEESNDVAGSHSASKFDDDLNDHIVHGSQNHYTPGSGNQDLIPDSKSNTYFHDQPHDIVPSIISESLPRDSLATSQLEADMGTLNSIVDAIVDNSTLPYLSTDPDILAGNYNVSSGISSQTLQSNHDVPLVTDPVPDIASYGGVCCDSIQFHDDVGNTSCRSEVGDDEDVQHKSDLECVQPVVEELPGGHSGMPIYSNYELHNNSWPVADSLAVCNTSNDSMFQRDKEQCDLSVGMPLEKRELDDPAYIIGAYQPDATPQQVSSQQVPSHRVSLQQVSSVLPLEAVHLSDPSSNVATLYRVDPYCHVSGAKNDDLTVLDESSRPSTVSHIGTGIHGMNSEIQHTALTHVNPDDDNVFADYNETGLLPIPQQHAWTTYRQSVGGQGVVQEKPVEMYYGDGSNQPPVMETYIAACGGSLREEAGQLKDTIYDSSNRNSGGVYAVKDDLDEATLANSEVKLAQREVSNNYDKRLPASHLQNHGNTSDFDNYVSAQSPLYANILENGFSKEDASKQSNFRTSKQSNCDQFSPNKDTSPFLPTVSNLINFDFQLNVDHVEYWDTDNDQVLDKIVSSLDDGKFCHSAQNVADKSPQTKLEEGAVSRPSLGHIEPFLELDLQHGDIDRGHQQSSLAADISNFPVGQHSSDLQLPPDIISRSLPDKTPNEMGYLPRGPDLTRGQLNDPGVQPDMLPEKHYRIPYSPDVNQASYHQIDKKFDIGHNRQMTVVDKGRNDLGSHTTTSRHHYIVPNVIGDEQTNRRHGEYLERHIPGEDRTDCQVDDDNVAKEHGCDVEAPHFAPGFSNIRRRTEVIDHLTRADSESQDDDAPLERYKADGEPSCSNRAFVQTVAPIAAAPLPQSVGLTTARENAEGSNDHQFPTKPAYPGRLTVNKTPNRRDAKHPSTLTRDTGPLSIATTPRTMAEGQPSTDSTLTVRPTASLLRLRVGEGEQTQLSRWTDGDGDANPEPPIPSGHSPAIAHVSGEHQDVGESHGMLGVLPEDTTTDHIQSEVSTRDTSLRASLFPTTTTDPEKRSHHSRKKQYKKRHSRKGQSSSDTETNVSSIADEVYNYNIRMYEYQQRVYELQEARMKECWKYISLYTNESAMGGHPELQNYNKGYHSMYTHSRNSSDLRDYSYTVNESMHRESSPVEHRSVYSHGYGPQVDLSSNVTPEVPVGRLEERGRKTPLRYPTSRSFCRFGPGSKIVIVAEHSPRDGVSACATIQTMGVIVNDREAGYMGPLDAVASNKVEAIRFCSNRIQKASLESDDAALLWQLVSLLIRQNGIIFNLDIADLLLQEQPIEAPIESEVGRRNQSMDRIRAYLVSGRKWEALEIAMNCHYWDHALLLSEDMEPEVRQRVRSRFISMFSASDTLCTFYHASSGSVPPNLGHVAANWRPHVATLLSNADADVLEHSLGQLAEYLAAKGNIHASHFCSLLNDREYKGTKLGLLSGGSSTWDSFFLTEMYEYGKSLADPSFHVYLLAEQRWKYVIYLLDNFRTNEALKYLRKISQCVILSPDLFALEFIDKVYQLASRLCYFDSGLDKLQWLDQLLALRGYTEMEAVALNALLHFYDHDHLAASSDYQVVQQQPVYDAMSNLQHCDPMVYSDGGIGTADGVSQSHAAFAEATQTELNGQLANSASSFGTMSMGNVPMYEPAPQVTYKYPEFDQDPDFSSSYPGQQYSGQYISANDQQVGSEGYSGEMGDVDTALSASSPDFTDRRLANMEYGELPRIETELSGGAESSPPSPSSLSMSNISETSPSHGGRRRRLSSLRRSISQDDQLSSDTIEEEEHGILSRWKNALSWSTKTPTSKSMHLPDDSLDSKILYWDHDHNRWFRKDISIDEQLKSEEVAPPPTFNQIHPSTSTPRGSICGSASLASSDVGVQPTQVKHSSKKSAPRTRHGIGRRSTGRDVPSVSSVDPVPEHAPVNQAYESSPATPELTVGNRTLLYNPNTIGRQQLPNQAPAPNMFSAKRRLGGRAAYINPFKGDGATAPAGGVVSSMLIPNVGQPIVTDLSSMTPAPLPESHS